MFFTCSLVPGGWGSLGERRTDPQFWENGRSWADSGVCDDFHQLQRWVNASMYKNKNQSTKSLGKIFWIIASFFLIDKCRKSLAYCINHRAWEFMRVSCGIRYNKVLSRVQQMGQLLGKSASLPQGKNRIQFFGTLGMDPLWCASSQNSLGEAGICILLEFNNASSFFC